MRPPTGYVTIQLIMGYVRSVVIFFVLFFLPGCAWLGLAKNTVADGEVALGTAFVKTGKIFDPERLGKGGKLLVVPFPAGANVVANEQSDKIALMVVRGIADELKGSRFQVLDDENAHEADFVITGHMTVVSGPAKWDRWLLKKTTNTVSVEGRMEDSASEAAILVFTHSAQAASRRQDQAQLGYDIGKDIGRFIRSAGD